MGTCRSSLFVVAYFILAIFSVVWAETDNEEIANSVESLTDSVKHFNKGSKLAGILAREQARLSERITRECQDNMTYPPVDGVCNNMQNPCWGSPLQELRRLLKPAYPDGMGKPRIFGKGGKLLPSTRFVSTECFQSDSKETEDQPYSQMIMQWGQFLAHDVAGTPGTGVSGCCADMTKNGLHPDVDTGGPCFPIIIPEDDRHFQKCMEFSRSLPTNVESESCHREQLNVLTAYVDASNVYGSSEEELDILRAKTGGLLRTSEGDALPTSNHTTCVRKQGHSCYDAGDFRVNVFPGLTIMHTLWVREHNRIAYALAKINPKWDHERLFQETRKIVIALMQHITYNDYLYKVLGPEVYAFFDLSGKYEYNASVNPGIFNSFATAAFRFGHSQIAGQYKVKDRDNIDISKMYMDTSYSKEGFEDVLLGVLEIPNQKADSKFTPGVTDNLFVNTSKVGKSSDLVALNIQRGRDHGLPPYLDFVFKWSGIFRNQSLLQSRPTIPLCAIGLYDNLHDVDLYTGGMDEAPMTGAMIGPTFAFIIGQQFYNLKVGDRFWYENRNGSIGFSDEQEAEIRKVVLSRICCENSEIKEIQPDVFRLPDDGENKKVSCDTLPSMDLEKWRDAE